MTQDTVWKQIVEDRERAAGPSRVDVDQVVARGRSRVRRRRAVGVGLGSVAVASAVTGVVALSALGGRPDAVAPADGDVSVVSTFEGCTLEPRTCEGTLVADWMEERLGVQRPTGAGFTAVHPEGAGAAHLPDGAWEFSGGEVSMPGDGQQARLDLLVAPAAGESSVFDPADAGPDQDWEERTVEVVPGVEAEVSSTGSGGSWFEMWVVRDGSGHGALALAFEGTRVPGWTDANVSALLETLLEERPTAG